MGWQEMKDINHVGKVNCKSFINNKLHTDKRMIGYYLKDMRRTHFQHVMFRISDEDIVA